MKSNPEEVERFCDFIQETAPFDVVLDALNVANGSDSKKVSTPHMAGIMKLLQQPKQLHMAR